MQGEDSLLRVSSENQRGFEQHRFLQAIAHHLCARQGPVPESKKHEGVGYLTLRRIDRGGCEFTHGELKISVTQRENARAFREEHRTVRGMARERPGWHAR